MSLARRMFLSVLSAVLILGSLYGIAAEQQQSTDHDRLRLYGLIDDSAPKAPRHFQEYPLDRGQYLAPFDQSRLQNALGQMLDRHDGIARVRAALADTLHRYDELRRDGQHYGPALNGLRLYQLETNRPDGRTLVAEVRRR